MAIYSLNCGNPCELQVAAPEQGYASALEYEITWCAAANSVARVVMMDPFGGEKEIWTRKVNVWFL
jgi:hypothetical protein